MNISIKSLGPRGHLEAASFILNFKVNIIENEIYEKDNVFYGYFLVDSSEDFYEIIKEYSSDILVEIPPESLSI